MSIDTTGLLQSGAAVVVEAILTLSGVTACDSRTYFWHVQESFPYVTSRLGDFTVDDDGEEIDLYSYLATFRVVIGHSGENYDGELEAWLVTAVPVIIQYINQRELLTSVAYPTPIDDIEFARVVNGVAYTHFVNTPVGGVTQIGAEITIRAVFREEIVQARANL